MKLWNILQYILIPLLITPLIAAVEEQPRTGYACEGSTLRIKCWNDTVINVIRANYGRLHVAVCNENQPVQEWNIYCMSPNSARVVHDLCQDKDECWVPATNRFFGDPCGDTPKYLEVRYRCVEAERTTPTFKTRPFRPPTTTTSLPPTTTSRKIKPKPTTTQSTTTSTRPVVTTTKRPTTTRRRPTTKKPVVGSCIAAYVRNISWTATSPGDTAFEICPNNPYQMAEWRCRPDGNWMGSPDLSRCVSPKTIKLETQMNNDSPMEVAEAMVEVTEEDLFGGDVTELTKVMNDLVGAVETQTYLFDNEHQSEMGTEMVNHVNKAVIEAGSNLIDDTQAETWHDLPQATQRETASQLIRAVEESAIQVAERVNIVPAAPIINIEINIVMEIKVVDTRRESTDVVLPDMEYLKGSKWEDKSDSIKLSSATLKEFSVDGLAKLIFLTYDNLNDLMKPQQDRPAENEVDTAKETMETKYKTSDNGHHVKDNHNVDQVEVTTMNENKGAEAKKKKVPTATLR